GTSQRRSGKSERKLARSSNGTQICISRCGAGGSANFEFGRVVASPNPSSGCPSRDGVVGAGGRIYHRDNRGLLDTDDSCKAGGTSPQEIGSNEDRRPHVAMGSQSHRENLCGGWLERGSRTRT